FLEGGVAGPLTDTVDGALDLAGAVHDGGERVGHRLPQGVVAVHRQHDPVQAVDARANPRDALAPLLRTGVPHRVGGGDGAGRGPGVDRRRQQVAHVLEVRARGVLRRELYVFAVAPSVTDRLHPRLHDLRPALAKLILEVDVGGGHEGMDPRLARVAHSLPAT